MKPLLYLTCLLGVASATMAQDSTGVLRRTPRVVVKLAPLSLVDIDATVQAAIEFPVAVQTTIHAEGGYGWPGLSRSSAREGGVTNKQTGRVRVEARYYLPNTKNSVNTPYPTGLYVSGEALSKRLSVERSQTVVYPCLVAPCPTNTETATVNRTVFGGHVKVGYQTGFGSFYTSKNVSRLVFDFYLGLGARHIRVRQSDGSSLISTNGSIPDGVRFTRFVPGRNFWAGSLSGGFKIGFAL